MPVTVDDVKELIPALACLPDCSEPPTEGAPFEFLDGTPFVFEGGAMLFLPD